jgi:two-component system response regulator NreC
MNVIRVFMADDHAIFREGLRQLLNNQADIEVVGEASNGVETLEKVREMKPDVLVLDISMPRLNGMEAIGLIKGAVPDTGIVILSMHRSEAYAKQALEKGALGYVLKGAPSIDLLTAIRAAHRGEHYLSPKIQADVIEAYLEGRGRTPLGGGYDLLSEREKQVFHLLVEGNSTRQISNVLCVSSKTVEKHRVNITNKLNISNLAEMVKYAIRIGIIDTDSWKD